MRRLITEYLATGANRHPSVADWDESGVLAFGADRNVALWRPQDLDSKGIFSLLSGHTDIVNVVKFAPKSRGTLLSGSVDKTVRIWRKTLSSECYSCTQIISDHESSINCIAVTAASGLFATGSADATIKIWSLADEGLASHKQSITVSPRFFPLALSLSPLANGLDSYVLAAAGTKDVIHLYVQDSHQSAEFNLQASLSGHEGWIRSLEFTRENGSATSDLLLSSASQDKYIRLWRIHQGKELPAAAASADASLGAFLPGKALSNKAHRFRAEGLDFSATFEALLLGHEDWIYSTRWRSNGQKLQLLSSSADNSLAIWEPDAATGVWVTITRLGEISSEKGSTTATGSTGGFWTGLWSPSGSTVVSLGRTGSWRLWNYAKDQDRWNQGIGISGHTQSVTGIAWSKGGDYILSTSSDQTTRLHAKWKRAGQESWHEMTRPQIHGYDINCIDSLGVSKFVSGADEKLLRVFAEPRAVAGLLNKLCGFGEVVTGEMADAANIPVLGLSNKAIQAVEDGQEVLEDDWNDRDTAYPSAVVYKSTLNLNHPPFEDHLSKHTLWPEIEKLYGHGYEISCLASSHDGKLIATACKATSFDHAVIRIFETEGWHEVKPPLTAHTLTVTRLRFSENDNLLLSVGRDRQWTLFKRDQGQRNNYKMSSSNPKGHTRMILDAAWAPTSLATFATAGRDKQIKIWAENKGSEDFTQKATISEDHPVTAIDFLNVSKCDNLTFLAVGTEVGTFRVYSLAINQEFSVSEIQAIHQISYPHPSKAITQLAWRPTHEHEGDFDMEFAVASEDSSLRIYTLKDI